MTNRLAYVTPSDEGAQAERGRSPQKATEPACKASASPVRDQFDAPRLSQARPAADAWHASSTSTSPAPQGAEPPHDRAWYTLAALATYELLTTLVLFAPKLIVRGISACMAAVSDYFDPKLVLTEADIVLSTRHSSTREKRANYERYLGAMLMPSVWGGELEIAAFGALTHTPFAMYDQMTVDPPVFLRKMELNAVEQQGDEPRLSLVRTGEHYQVVRHDRPAAHRTDFDGATFINMPGDGNCLFYALAYLSDRPGVRVLIEDYGEAGAQQTAESGAPTIPEALLEIGQAERERIVNHIAVHADDYLERLDLVVVNALADR